MARLATHQTAKHGFCQEFQGSRDAVGSSCQGTLKSLTRSMAGINADDENEVYRQAWKKS
jgi:hypothetical protein